MVGKARVHELAKEFGVESKVVLAKLKELGEFVKAASSTVEPPVVRKLREVFPTVAALADAPPAKPKPAPRTAAPSHTNDCAANSSPGQELVAR